MFVETVPFFELLVNIFVWQHSARTLATIVNKTETVPFFLPRNLKSLIFLNTLSEILSKFIAID